MREGTEQKMDDGDGDAGSHRGAQAGKGKPLKTLEKTKLSVLLRGLAQLENWRLSIYSVKACFPGRETSR